MTIQIIPLQSVPAQTITVALDGQTCQITVRQRFFGLYLDLSINDTLIVGGVACENLNRIVRDGYLGFSGDLAFLDQQGTSDPDYTGLGDRFVLAYLEPSDLAALGFSA